MMRYLCKCKNYIVETEWKKTENTICRSCGTEFVVNKERTTLIPVEQVKLKENRLLQFFKWSHLKPELQKVSMPFCDLAEYIDSYLPNNPEKTVALRKLLEAKDCAVRAVIYKEPN